MAPLPLVLANTMVIIVALVDDNHATSWIPISCLPHVWVKKPHSLWGLLMNPTLIKKVFNSSCSKHIYHMVFMISRFFVDCLGVVLTKGVVECLQLACPIAP
jgi:hypothetical protein